MKTFFSLATIALTSAVAVMADFPGASMNFTYSTTSNKIANVGFLKLVSQGDHNLTSLTPTLEQNVTAQMTHLYNPGPLMVGICPQPQREAMIVPTTEFAEIDYIWRWGGSDTEVPGTLTYAVFGLTNPPDYDRLSLVLDSGEWRAVEFNGHWVVGWSNTTGNAVNSIPINIVSSPFHQSGNYTLGQTCPDTNQP